MRVFLSLFLLVAACKKDAPAGSARDCLGYLVPAGWALAPSRTGADVVLRGPTRFRVAGRELNDTILVRFVPARGLSLETYKDTVVRLTSQPGAAGTVNQLAQKHPGTAGSGVGAREVGPAQATKVPLAAGDAYRIDVESTLTLEGTPVKMKNRSYVLRHGDEFVQVSVAAPAERAGEVHAVGESFMASLRLDACRK